MGQKTTPKKSLPPQSGALTPAGEIWARQPGESARAYAAFEVYLQLGAERSLAAVRQGVQKTKSLIERWSAGWQWVARAAAYDGHVHSIGRRAADAYRAERAEFWLKRDDDLRERRWSNGQAMLEKAEKMLRFPLSAARQTVNGKAIFILPARWSFAHAALLIEVGIAQSQASIRNAGSIRGEAGDGRAEVWVVEDYAPVGRKLTAGGHGKLQ